MDVWVRRAGFGKGHWFMMPDEPGKFMGVGCAGGIKITIGYKEY